MKRGEKDYKKKEFEKLIQDRVEENIIIPDGYTIIFEDTQKIINESVASLAGAILISILLIYLILGIQFNSIRLPLIIIVTIHLGLLALLQVYLFFNQQFL